MAAVSEWRIFGNDTFFSPFGCTFGLCRPRPDLSAKINGKILAASKIPLTLAVFPLTFALRF